MFCTKCGAMVEISHNFCSRCGTAVQNPLPNVPHAPPAPISLDSDEYGDEAVLYSKRVAHYLKEGESWVPGVFIFARIYLAFNFRSYGQPVRIHYNEIDAISDAYVRDRYVCFSVRTIAGIVETFSVDAYELEETQAVISRLRAAAGIQKVFNP